MHKLNNLTNIISKQRWFIMWKRHIKFTLYDMLCLVIISLHLNGHEYTYAFILSAFVMRTQFISTIDVLSKVHLYNVNQWMVSENQWKINRKLHGHQFFYFTGGVAKFGYKNPYNKYNKN